MANTFSRQARQLDVAVLVVVVDVAVVVFAVAVAVVLNK